MKKKLVSVFLISTIVVFTAACGNSNVSESTTQKSESEIATEETSTESSEESASTKEVSNTIKKDSNTIKAEKSEEIKAPSVGDYGYVVVQGSNQYYVEYAYEMTNENQFDIEFPTVKITVKDESGAILTTDEDVRDHIAAGDTVAQAGQVACDSIPASIEIVGIEPDEYNIIDAGSTSATTDFTISNLSLQSESVTGEITNDSDSDYDSVTITALYKDADGNIVTGATDYYTNKISAGETTAFEIYCMFDPGDFDYETVTVTAYGDSY